MRIRNPNSPRSPREDGVNRPSRGPRGPIAPPVGKGPRGPIAPPVGKGPRGPIASPVIGPRKGGKPMPPNMKKGAPMGGAIEKMPRGGAFMGRRPKR